MPETIEVPIPEPLLRALGGKTAELSRRAFEALVANQYRTGELTHFEVSQLLGIDRFQTDGFLKKHVAFQPDETADYQNDFERLRKLTK
jgi:hypothetical protein